MKTGVIMATQSPSSLYIFSSHNLTHKYTISSLLFQTTFMAWFWYFTNS